MTLKVLEEYGFKHSGKETMYDGEQKGEGLVNRFGINHMVVVQDEDEMVRDGGDFVEQGCQKSIRLAAAEGIGAPPTPLLQYFGHRCVCKAATR